MKLIRLLCLVVISTPIALQSQSLWELGFQGGGTVYAGDLSPKKVADINAPDFGGGVFIRRNIIPDLSVRLNLLAGQISGDESRYSEPYWRKDRAFSFHTPFFEPDLLIEWDLWAHKRTANMQFHRVLSPYLFGGPGLIFYKPQTNYNHSTSQPNPSVSTDKIEADLRESDFSPKFTWVFGGGWKYDLNLRWSLGVEMGIRKVNSDFIDGVQNAGNPNLPDWYGYGGLTLVRRLYQTDTDRDFIPNKYDHCPLVAGPRKMKGCPDADGDRITDSEDQCPNEFGKLSAKGCPDYDGDGVRDSADRCPDVIGTLATAGCPDSDRDGVADKDDLCPVNPGSPELDGCPDVDRDGLADIYDECPEQGGQVALNGCPDKDNDGIDDKVDLCPDVPGLTAFKGCPDTDGDDIQDSEDKCPTVKGLIAFAGCPDTDSDGIQDSEDKCPTVKGLFAFAGCPDTDGDGIQDAEDGCPTQKGLAVMKGCPDTDGDGLSDKDDYCPNVRGKLADRGCPEITKADKKAIDLAVRNVQFETGSDALKAASLPVLDQVAEILNRYPNYKVRINGHTDSVGAAKANLDLSSRRAKSCVVYLTKSGVDAARLTAKGFGESKPISSNSTAAGRAKNRRVEFVLEK